jgi:D-alanyl-D-alanine carboxypeptidase/D-alanyl-D-alanine-endopeptidase (penicillin-binding protein 4)
MGRTPTRLVTLLLAVSALFGTLATGAQGSFCGALKSRLVTGGGSASGLYVLDAGTGRPVCSSAATRPRPLASNTKLFTTSAVLSKFGPDATIPTRVLAVGRIDEAGVLHGDLYLKGGGDPALGTPAFYDSYLAGVGTNIFKLKRQIREAGVTAVTGRLYADDTIFDRLRGVADSNYATSPYIGPLSGLAFDSGFGDTAASHFAADPAKVAAATLASSLRSAGISLKPGIALAETPAKAVRIAVVHSPTINRLVETTDVNSDNFFAEMLLKLLGAHYGEGGTTAAGAKVVEAFARSQGSGIHSVDGSGLTRSNRASPQQVVQLLDSVREGEDGANFVGDLALAGHEGTVADRMHGTAADGRCRTKTGTLTGVSNLSGYCFNSDGRTMIFSILMGSVGDLELAHLEQDLIAGAVASY